MGKNDIKLEKLAAKSFEGEELNNFKIWYRNISGDGKSLNDLLVEAIHKNPNKFIFDEMRDLPIGTSEDERFNNPFSFAELESVLWLKSQEELIKFKKNEAKIFERNNESKISIEDTIQRVSLSIILTDMQKDNFRNFINRNYSKIVNFDTKKMRVLFDDYYDRWSDSPYKKAIEFNKRLSYLPEISLFRETTKGSERKNF